MRLATRGSALARAQAELAAAALSAGGVVDIETIVVRTGGDRRKSTPIDSLEGQGWFTAELERAVADGTADAAVHSAKDLPTELAAGLAVVALLQRADPRDALVSRDGGLHQLSAGAVVGSSSARRAALLAEARPDLHCVAMRGNVDTRLGKLRSGEVDALLVAAAGLDRLGVLEPCIERLDPRRFVPAPAQGAIALETRIDSPAAQLCGLAGDPATALAVGVERGVLAALGGGCLLPLGVWARLEGERLVASAALGVDGGIRRAELAGDCDRPLELAARLAAALR